MLLDQEGFECDPINKREGDTPLHSAVRWANEVSEKQMEFASSLIEMRLEAGSDPRFVFLSLQYGYTLSRLGIIVGKRMRLNSFSIIQNTQQGQIKASRSCRSQKFELA
jgi:hypothetical protein